LEKYFEINYFDVRFNKKSDRKFPFEISISKIQNKLLRKLLNLKKIIGIAEQGSADFLKSFALLCSSIIFSRFEVLGAYFEWFVLL
jgi:hypothetical protein